MSERLSKKLVELRDIAVRDATDTTDPIEIHIIQTLQKLRYQNKRYKSHIDKTEAWTNVKNIKLWKPFDFYHHFCNKYQERYGIEYPQTGNQVLVYSKIEQFCVQNAITKEDYKAFIDKAFERHFNKINVPRVSAVCSMRLYKHLMGVEMCNTTEDFQNMDNDIVEEAKKFDKFVEDWNASNA